MKSIETEALVVGAGYSGVLLSSILAERGVDVLIAKSSLESEIEVFLRLEVLSSYYSEFIEEYRELLAQLRPRVLKTTILKTERENGEETERARWKVESPHYRITADEVFICTGCYDKRVFPCGVLGMRPAGTFSLQNALELISKGYRIGRRVLLFGERTKIFEIVEEMLKKLKYECEFVEGEYAEVLGRERVEGVVVEGEKFEREKFECDTLIYFCGRESFNPFRLEGVKAGNINAKTYDYEEVRRDVLRLKF